MNQTATTTTTPAAIPGDNVPASNVIAFPHPIPEGAHRTNDAIVWGDIDDAILDRQIGVAVAPTILSPCWANVRTDFLTFLGTRLTKFEVRIPKDGLAFTQGVIEGGDAKAGASRKQAAVTALDLMVIDLDTGQDREELLSNLRKLGWFAVVATTHSHLKSESEVKRDTIVQRFKDDREPTLADVCDYLSEVKKYRPHILESPELVDAKRRTPNGVMMVVRHRPMPKMRIVLLLKESFNVADRMTGRKTLSDVVNEWQAKYAAVSERIGAFYDRSCSDLGRGFYTPSRKPSATDWRIDVLPGAMLDLDTIETEIDENPFATAAKQMGAGKVNDGKDSKGKLFFKLYGHRFDLETFLLECDPDGDIEQRSRGGRTHKCPFIHEHTLPESGREEDDKGFYCVNAEDSETGQAVAHCQHDSCKGAGRDRIDYVGAILARDGMTWADLREWVNTLKDEPDFDPAPFLDAPCASNPAPFPNVKAAKDAAAAVPDADVEEAGRVAHRLGLSNLKAAEIEAVKLLLCGKRVRFSPTAFKAEFKRGQADRPVVSEPGTDAPVWCPPDLIIQDTSFYTWRLVETAQGKVRHADKFVCRLFEPVARVTDADGILRGLRIAHDRREMTVTIDSLHTSKEQLAVTLHATHGLECGTTRQAHDALAELMRCALRHDGLTTVVEVQRPGWHFDGAVFVCANGHVVGAAPGGVTVRLADDSGYKERAPDGVGDPSKEAAIYARVWRDGPALWRFADLIGLAAPCLDVVGCRSGGFVLDGTTRHGKTTAQHLQVARAGCPDEGVGTGGLIPFNPSPEAAEIPLRNATSNPFAMDELQNVKDPRDLQRFIFAMAGGSGKVRMKRSADAMRETFTWRVLTTISTERTVADVLRSAGKAMVGGLVARYPSLSVSGLCDHTAENGALAQDIKLALFANYGHTFATFIERALVGTDRAKAVGEWRELQAELVGDDDHLKAPAEFFALCWWAGNQAARVGLTEGLTTERVAETVAMAWQSFAGREEGNALAPGVAEIEALREYIATHRDRTIVRTDASGLDGTFQDRVGFYDAEHYYLLASKLDVVTGGTGNRATTVQALRQAGVLVLPTRGRDLTIRKVPGIGDARNYCLSRPALDGADDAADGGDRFRQAAHDMRA